jgi:hypothetical protein
MSYESKLCYYCEVGYHKLLVVGFIQPIEKVIWLSLIVVVPKKNWQIVNMC